MTTTSESTREMTVVEAMKIGPNVLMEMIEAFFRKYGNAIADDDTAFVETSKEMRGDEIVIKVSYVEPSFASSNKTILFEISFSPKHGRTVRFNPWFKSENEIRMLQIYSVFTLLEFNFTTLDV